MKQSQTHKPAKKWRKSAVTPVNICYKRRESYNTSGQKRQKTQKNTKTAENSRMYRQMYANKRNHKHSNQSRQSKIAAQRREKRIKTTTCNTPSTARLVGSAAQNRKRNPPAQRTEATAVRSAPCTTKQAETIANNRKQKTSYNKTNTHQRWLSRGAVRSGGRYALERLECAPQKKKKHTGRQPQPIQPIKLNKKQQNKSR